MNKNTDIISSQERHKIIPASYLLLKDGDKILMQRRFNTGYKDGEYSLVAGHVDAGESFTQAMIREAKEEANIILKAENMELRHMRHKLSPEDGSERVDVFFVAEKWEGEIKNIEPHKCDDLRWFERDALPENIVDEVLDAIESIEKGIFYKEVGWNK